MALKNGKVQNCAQKLPNVTSETHIEKDDFSYFFLLFPPAAAAAPATLLKPIEKMIVATFSFCFLLLLLLLLPRKLQFDV